MTHHQKNIRAACAERRAEKLAIKKHRQKERRKLKLVVNRFIEGQIENRIRARVDSLPVMPFAQKREKVRVIVAQERAVV